MHTERNFWRSACASFWLIQRHVHVETSRHVEHKATKTTNVDANFFYISWWVDTFQPLFSYSSNIFCLLSLFLITLMRLVVAILSCRAFFFLVILFLSPLLAISLLFLVCCCYDVDAAAVLVFHLESRVSVMCMWHESAAFACGPSTSETRCKWAIACRAL